MSEVKIRLIGQSDLKDLLLWKNSHRKFFFHQKLINESQHLNWYQSYLSGEDNLMFIVEVFNVSIGCMGIRKFESDWDIYNVILGDKSYSKKGYMGKALQQMISLAISQSNLPVRLKVLTDNPAISWYKANFFVVTCEKSNFSEMLYVR
jgi:RimJ/RimL family protein N-acetyltransferase